jgi:hypothetical protein
MQEQQTEIAVDDVTPQIQEAAIRLRRYIEELDHHRCSADEVIDECWSKLYRALHSLEVMRSMTGTLGASEVLDVLKVRRRLARIRLDAPFTEYNHDAVEAALSAMQSLDSAIEAMGLAPMLV